MGGRAPLDRILPGQKSDDEDFNPHLIVLPEPDLLLVCTGSWDFGSACGLACSDHREKISEQIVAIVWTGRRLGMILDRKKRDLAVPESFVGPIVQIDVRDLDFLTAE